MTSHMTAQPRHCLQCLRIGLLLTHGRCSTCRGRTPAAVWNEHHGAKPRDSEANVSSAVLNDEEAAATLQHIRESIASAQIHRVEQIGKRCVSERHINLDTGVSVQRVTLIVTEWEGRT